MTTNDQSWQTKPKFWKSLLTKNLFPFYEYANHGKGRLYSGYKDLPKDGYPYTIIYEEPKIPLWKLNTIQYFKERKEFDNLKAFLQRHNIELQ